MIHTHTLAVRVSAFFLLAAVCLVQWANLSWIQKTVDGAPSHVDKLNGLQADGPLPPPPPPKLGFKRFTTS
jgi:hypothetical protein